MAEEIKKEETKAVETKSVEQKPVEQKAPEVKAPPKAPEQTGLSDADKLKMLHMKADTLGVGYTSDTTAEVLLQKISDAMEGKKEQKVENSVKQKTPAELRQEAYNDCMYLVRVRITNMNPQKADLPGEIFTVSNRIVGEVKRYIPYGEQIDGWHVEKILLDMLKEKKFNQIKTRKGSNGQILPETKWVKEFAIEELPPLTEKELKVLANKQAAAAGMSND